MAGKQKKAGTFNWVAGAAVAGLLALAGVEKMSQMFDEIDHLRETQRMAELAELARKNGQSALKVEVPSAGPAASAPAPGVENISFDR